MASANIYSEVTIEQVMAYFIKGYRFEDKNVLSSDYWIDMTGGKARVMIKLVVEDKGADDGPTQST